MDVSATLAQAKALSVDDRIRLVQEIWDSISTESEQIGLTEAQRLELSRRLKNRELNPQGVVSWQDVKAQALSRARTHQ